MTVQRLDREDMPAFEGDQLLADIVRGRVDLRNGSLHNEIDDSSLCVITHARNTFLNRARFTTDCTSLSGILEHGEHKELTRWAGVTTTERLVTRFIAWESGTDLGIYFSDSESKTSRKTNLPIRRPPDIHDGHTSKDTLPNTEHM